MLKRVGISWSELITAWVCITIGGIWLFRQPLLHPENILFFSDVIHVWFFIKTFTIESIRQFGQIPLWNPLIFSGVPFVSNPQSVLFYPPFWIFLFIPVHYAITLLFAFHAIFAGCGMYLYARCRRLTVWSALFASMVFMFNGKVMGHIFAGHLTQTCAWSYIPWIFCALDNFVFVRKISSVLILAGGLALCFLCGQMQIFYYTVCIGSAYLIYIAIRKDPAGIISCLIRYLLCAMIVFVLIAVSLIPILEMMRFFHRAGGTDFAFASSFSLRWRDLITAIFPYFFVFPHHGSNILNDFFWERTVYCGIVPLFLLLISYRQRQKIYWQFFIGLLLFCTLFALGNCLPILKICYLLIPGIPFFRCPARIFLFAGFSIALLAGYAIQNIAEDRFNDRIKSIYRITFLLAVSLLCISEILYYSAHIIISGARISILILLLFSLIVFMWKKGYMKKTFFILSVFCLTLFDLGSKADLLIKSIPLTQIVPSSRIYNGIIQDNSVFRIYDTIGAFAQYLGALYNVEQIGGDEPVMLKQYLAYIRKMNNTTPANDAIAQHHTITTFPIADLSKSVRWQLLNFLNVKYILTNHILKEPFLIQEDSQILSDSLIRFFNGSYTPITRKVHGILSVKTYLYRNTHVLPRAFLIPANNRINIDKQLDTFIENSSHILLPAQIISYSPNKIVIKTESKKPATLITSEILYPGWQVCVDGKQKNIQPIYNLFRGVYVGKATHTVTFTYKPKSYRIGKQITLGGLLFITIGIAMSAWGRKKTKLFSILLLLGIFAFTFIA